MTVLDEERHPFANAEDGNLPPQEDVRGVKEDHVEMPDARFGNGKTFAFDGSVAENFETKVISKQIPGYTEMRHVLLNTALHTAKPDGYFLDLGTSNGRMIRDFALARAEQGMNLGIERFVGIDIEADMLTKAESLFKEVSEQIAPRRFNYDLMNYDLRKGLPNFPKQLSIVTSVFTIQFIPPEHRLRILTDIYDNLLPGAPFIWAEKVIARHQSIDDVLTDVYYEHKSRNGIDDETIRRKRESLEGNLMPFTHDGNVELLEAAGFNPRKIDTIWRNLQFEAVIAIK